MSDLPTLPDGLAPDPEPQPQGETVQIHDLPVTIHMTSGKVFRVEDKGAWAYMEDGVFATGKWGWSDTVQSVLIPYGRIEVVELHFDEEDDESPGS